MSREGIEPSVRALATVLQAAWTTKPNRLKSKELFEWHERDSNPQTRRFKFRCYANSLPCRNKWYRRDSNPQSPRFELDRYSRSRTVPNIYKVARRGVEPRPTVSKTVVRSTTLASHEEVFSCESLVFRKRVSLLGVEPSLQPSQSCVHIPHTPRTKSYRLRTIDYRLPKVVQVGFEPTNTCF